MAYVFFGLGLLAITLIAAIVVSLTITSRRNLEERPVQ
jgi:hypothetical protein